VVQVGSWLESQQVPFSGEFACSASVCLGSLRVHLLISDSKLTRGVSGNVHGCLSLCGIVMDWQPVLGAPCLSPNGSWDRLQPPETLYWINRK